MRIQTVAVPARYTVPNVIDFLVKVREGRLAFVDTILIKQKWRGGGALGSREAVQKARAHRANTLTQLPLSPLD